MSERFYHGGYGGLRVGDLVLPSCKTGAPSTADYGADDVCRRDRVYVTTSEQAARMFGAMHQSARGRAYEVEPIGELETDPDCRTPGLSYQVAAARVVRVIQISRHERISAAIAVGAIEPDEDAMVARRKAAR